MKCCVIGTPMGGIKEIIKDHENGVLVGTTAEELKDAMALLIEDKKQRELYGSKLHDTVMQEFSWSVTAKKVLYDIGVGD